MRRSAVAMAICCIFVLLGAVKHPPPTPTPTPSPVPTPPMPVVMFYPFTVNGEADKNAGLKLATLYMAQIQHDGGITLLPVAPMDTPRTNYLVNAQKLNADYYVSGYLTPLGEQVAIVEQIVSTQTGSIVWSNTAQVLTYADALSEAQSVRIAVLRHAGRLEAQYQAQQEARATPTPAAANETETSIGSILGIFKRHPKQQVALAPGQKPAAPVVVGDVGAPNAADAGTAASVLEHAMDRAYNVTRAKTCAGSTGTIATGSLHSEQTKSLPSYTRQVFTLNIVRCSGGQLFSTTASASSIDDAINEAVNRYITAHPKNA
ncbi:MAG: hypothetical protein JOZ38_11845 [Candidatus Eremiobacteraeota bacterium]|nr:hypothetical protein [Candidatus Eremiobacteraeota bacterium]